VLQKRNKFKRNEFKRTRSSNGLFTFCTGSTSRSTSGNPTSPASNDQVATARPTTCGYVDNSDAWLPAAYTFLSPEDQAALRTVGKFGQQQGSDNVDRTAIRVSAQNIYRMLGSLQPLKKRLELQKLQKKMRRIMCGVARTVV
jgi:predicted metalloprotease